MCSPIKLTRPGARAMNSGLAPNRLSNDATSAAARCLQNQPQSDRSSFMMSMMTSIQGSKQQARHCYLWVSVARKASRSTTGTALLAFAFFASISFACCSVACLCFCCFGFLCGEPLSFLGSLRRLNGHFCPFDNCLFHPISSCSINHTHTHTLSTLSLLPWGYERV